VKTSLSVDYKFIGMSLGFSPKYIVGNDDNFLKGKTSFINYSFRCFFNNWTQEVIYKNTQGYYVKNTQDFIPNWTNGKDPHIQFPDLKTIKWGGNTSYILNDEFSLRNVVYQNEWQRKSTGSFIPSLEYFFNRLSNKVNALKIFENAFNIQFSPSYYYTFVVHENWFISTFISPKLGMRFSNYQEGGNRIIFKEKKQHIISELDGGLQLGFSSKKIIFGVKANFYMNWYNDSKTTTVIENKVYTKMYFGYRFNSPKILQKKIKWINEKI